MASGSADNIKQWKFPDGNFIQNLSGHNAIINALTVNPENVLVSGGRCDKQAGWDYFSKVIQMCHYLIETKHFLKS